jgi:hypothetical protein
MFDDDKSVSAFLSLSQKRFAKFPDAKQPVAAERYMKYPSQKLDDVADTRKPLPTLDRHAKGEFCPGTPPVAPGTVFARLFGRALDKDGKPVADTIRQEHYVEDRFEIPVEVQQQLAKALAAADGMRFRLPDGLARLLVSHAYLGQLDVDPVAAPGSKGQLKQCEFWAEQLGGTNNEKVVLRVSGHSVAVGGDEPGDRVDGRVWSHEVNLSWQGLIELRAGRISRLLLLASGNEKLKWGNAQLGPHAQADVTHLPAGHAIDLACGVRFGIMGEPAPADRVSDKAPPSLIGRPVAPVPQEARQQLIGAFGPKFGIFTDRVQEELKLTSEQREKIQDRLAVTMQEAQDFFRKQEGRPHEEVHKQTHDYRERAEENLAAFLHGALNKDQLQRMEQIELQQHGAFALMQPKMVKELQITDDQRQHVAMLLQELQRKVEPLMKELQSGGQPQEVGPKILKLRTEQETKIAELLDEMQKKRWQEILGKPFRFND